MPVVSVRPTPQHTTHRRPTILLSNGAMLALTAMEAEVAVAGILEVTEVVTDLTLPRLHYV